MKFNFKKISAIAISTLMTGMTMGVAAAASYPAPFVSGGVANTAIVYGTGTGVSDLDRTYSGNIQTDLQKYITSTGGTTTIEGGESYKIEKTSTKFNLGDGITDVVSATINDDKLPTLLADGVFIDDDNDEFDYTQEITLANLSLTMFDDNDYKRDTPTVGIKINNGANVLNYTLDFTDEPEWTDLETTSLPIMGKSYYVLDVSSTVGESITLLDSAMDTILSEGETSTVDGKSVSVEFISIDKVKLNVDGEVTNSLAEGQTYKLKDGSYLGIKDILYTSKDSGISKVEFSIGNGKLLLTDGSDVELNEKTVSNLGVTITNSSSKLASITLQWDADDDLFVAEDSIVTMPGFEAIKLSFTGLSYPAEENLMVESDGDSSLVLKDFPLKDSTETINFLYFNDTYYTLTGKDSDNLLVTSGTSSLTFDGNTDDWFLASWTDGNDAESYLMRVSSFKNESGTQKATFEYRKDGAWSTIKTDAEAPDTISIGNVEFDIYSLTKATKVAVINASGDTEFKTLYSKEGMKVYMPYVNSIATNLGATRYTAATACDAVIVDEQELYTGVVTYNSSATNTSTTTYCPTTFDLKFSEEDRNENIGDGKNITLTLSDDASDEVTVSAISGYNSNLEEIGSSDIYRAFVYSALATEVLYDKSGDQYKATLVYHGDEVTAGVYLTSPDAAFVSGDGTTAGLVMVTDSEVSSVSSKNLIIVGGSCINSAAARVLGFSGPTCGAAFTAGTGVGSGQFLIKSVNGAYATGKLAIVVAGYESADTVNAVQYLINKKPDTSKNYKGTSATVAEEVITSA